jgi:hypothetical protein
VIFWADRIADLKLPRIVAQANNIHAIAFGIDTIDQASEATSNIKDFLRGDQSRFAQKSVIEFLLSLLQSPVRAKRVCRVIA